MGLFFIDTGTGQVATLGQLVEAGVADGPRPGPPWHRIQGPSDASTLWYAVLRKWVARKSGRGEARRESAQDSNDGVYIGALAIRHQPHHASLLAGGWEEVAVDQIGLPGASNEIIRDRARDQAI